MKCVDASFIIRLVINNYSDNIYSDTWQQWQDAKTIIVAPTLTMYEVSN
jgi:predicted nucleic acid-binding protein